MTERVSSEEVEGSLSYHAGILSEDCSCRSCLYGRALLDARKELQKLRLDQLSMESQVLDASCRIKELERDRNSILRQHLRNIGFPIKDIPVGEAIPSGVIYLAKPRPLTAEEIKHGQELFAAARTAD